MNHRPFAPAAGPIAPQSLPVRLAAGFFLLVLLGLFVTTFIGNFEPDVFHEEFRILYHLDPAHTNDKDYAGEFLGRMPQPILYSLLTDAALGSGIDLVVFHKLLGAACMLLLLAGALVSGWRAGGPLVATLVAVMIAAQPVYNYQISSATPHAFAFPLLMWGLVCLQYDRSYWLAALTVSAGLLYPPVAPILGLALFWQIVIGRNGLGRDNADRPKDIAVIAVTAAVSFSLLLRQLAPVEGYGAALTPNTQIDTYPENGPSGRHFAGVFDPLGYVRVTAMDQFHEGLPILVLILLPLCVVALAFLGFYGLRNRPETFGALLGFMIPSAVLCSLVTLLKPYIAYRFLLYPLFTIMPLLFVCGLLALCYRYRAKLRYPTAVVVAVMASLTFAVSDINGHQPMRPLQLTQSASKLMAYLEELPADSLIVAWPGRTETSLIPYAAGQPVLVNYKAHYPLYEHYVENMRSRMFDIIDAYLAEDRQPLDKLRCRWRADYFVVERALTAGTYPSLSYFEPFNERIRSRAGTVDASRLILRDPPAAAVEFTAGPYTVINLEKLADGAACPDSY